MAEKRPWADAPFDLVPSPKFQGKEDEKHFTANEMAVSHNIYIRGLNAIYNQAEHITSEKDRADFLLFCQIWIEILEHHHDLEEEIFFTGLEKATGVKDLMKVNVDQHKAFHDGLMSFQAYLNETNPGSFDGKAIKAHIDEFGNALVTHLHDEIPTLLALERYDTDGLVARRIYKEFESKLVSRASLTRHHPFIFGCRDVSFENGVNSNWPGVPPIAGVGFTYLFSWKYKGVWRFLPSDFYGRPRALNFGPP